MASVTEHRVDRVEVFDDHHATNAANDMQDNEIGGDRDAVPDHNCSVGLSDAAHTEAMVEQPATLNPFPPLAFALPSLSASPLTEPPSA